MRQKCFLRVAFFFAAIMLGIFFQGEGIANNIKALSIMENEGKDVGKLRYNEVQFKAASNSRTKGSIEEQLEFHPQEPWRGGCQGLEFPLVQNPNKMKGDEPWEFVVQSGGKYLDFNPTLFETLRKIKKWSENHPGHHVITLHLTLKKGAVYGDDALFCEKLDKILAKGLGLEKIYTPAFLQRDALTLREAVEKYGWPTLDELRDGYIVVLSGDDTNRLIARRRLIYNYTRPYKRLAFVDMDQGAAKHLARNNSDINNPYYKQGMRVFLNIKAGNSFWTKLAHDAHEKGLVTRVATLKSGERWDLAMGANANVLATDHVLNTRWTALASPILSPTEDLYEADKAIATEKSPTNAEGQPGF